MQKLFGIPLDTLAAALFAVLLVAVGATAALALRNRENAMCSQLGVRRESAITLWATFFASVYLVALATTFAPAEDLSRGSTAVPVRFLRRDGRSDSVSTGALPS